MAMPGVCICCCCTPRRCCCCRLAPEPGRLPPTASGVATAGELLRSGGGWKGPVNRSPERVQWVGKALGGKNCLQAWQTTGHTFGCMPCTNPAAITCDEGVLRCLPWRPARGRVDVQHACRHSGAHSKAVRRRKRCLTVLVLMPGARMLT